MSSPSSTRRVAKQLPPTTGPPPQLTSQSLGSSQQQQLQSQQQQLFPQMSYNPQPEDMMLGQPLDNTPNSRKRKTPHMSNMTGMTSMTSAGLGDPGGLGDLNDPINETLSPTTAPKKSRTNTPWTPAEEQRLKTMRDAGNSWGEIAKTFPNRTEGSVKKHWYKVNDPNIMAKGTGSNLTVSQDMHYADFAEDESAALLAAIKEYEASKWKVIGLKVGKPAKACEQYAKEHFGGATGRI